MGVSVRRTIGDGLLSRSAEGAVKERRIGQQPSAMRDRQSVIPLLLDHDLHRDTAVVGCTVSELALVVAAPAVRLAIGRGPTSVGVLVGEVEAGAYHSELVSPQHGHR